MVSDDLVIAGARASAAMVLTSFILPEYSGLISTLIVA